MNTTIARIIPTLCLFATFASAAASVLLGVDVLQRDGFAPIAGKRVGLITNHTGVDGRGAPTADLLHRAEEVELVRLFGPEHGIRGELDQSMIEDGFDGPTGLPVVSLYGPRRKPTVEQLADLDAIVFDVQDIGCRFYTYISTLKLAMHTAAEAGVEVVVLDRPNPIGGVAVEGPVLDGPPLWGGEESFVGCHPLPLRHGMTIGELAKLFAAEGPGGEPLGVELTVVPCDGWRRDMLWHETGLVWINPSPNMRRLEQALVYPGVGLLETTNVSVGRGTDTPFEILGAPWIDARAIAAEMNGRGLPGVTFIPREFTPSSSKHAGERCGGVEIAVTNWGELEPVALGVHLAHAVRANYPGDWDSKRFPRLLIEPAMLEALLAGEAAERLVERCREGVEDFLARRSRQLMYAK